MGRKVMKTWASKGRGVLPQEDKPKKTKPQRRAEAKAALEMLRKDILNHLDKADNEIMDAIYLAEDLDMELDTIDNAAAWFEHVNLDSDLQMHRDNLLDIQEQLKKAKIIVDLWD